MKVIFCPTCKDVFAVRMKRWRKCSCGQCGGQYNEDALTATIGGRHAKVFGIANPFFDPEFENWSPAKRGAVHRQWEYGPSEIWWGGQKGDWQLIRIKSADGPRLAHDVVLKRIARILRAVKVRPVLNSQNPTLTATESVKEITDRLNKRRAEYRKARKRKKTWKAFRTAKP